MRRRLVISTIAIVLVVLTLAMGWRMGIIIGTSLVLTILATLVCMALMGIDLQRMSLGAIVNSPNLPMAGEDRLIASSSAMIPTPGSMITW